MKYEIYYESSIGEKLDLCKWPYMIYDGDLLDYDWSYDSSSNYGTQGGKITAFNRGIEKKKLNISIFGRSEIIYRKAVDTLADAIEHDVVSLNPGKLYVNGSYLECYIIGFKPDEWVSGSDFMNAELEIAAEYPFWLMDREYVFAKSGTTSTNDYRYPMRFPYRYPNGQTDSAIYQRHIKPCDFVLTINGPAQDPTVGIGSMKYGIKGKLEENEYILINSRRAYVRKYLADGSYINVYDDRVRDNGIYEKLPLGSLQIDWTGEFTFALTVVEERSLPRWSS